MLSAPIENSVKKKVVSTQVAWSICISLTICLSVSSYYSAPPLAYGAAGRNNSAARRQLYNFLRSYNTGSREILRGFFERQMDAGALEKRGVKDRTNAATGTFEITRQLNLVRYTSVSETKATALCQSRVTEAWFSLTIELTSGAPHKIVKQYFELATAPKVSNVQGRLRQSEVVLGLKKYLAKLAAANMLSGTILLSRNRKIILAEAFGVDEAKQNNQVNTKYDLASLVKMFTSVAIARLAENGTLSFNDVVGRFLPEYPNKEAREKVSLHHLLTHTSGLTEYSDKKEYRPARDQGGRFNSLSDWLPFFASDPLLFPPGTKSEYTNSDFIVLGLIIEKVTGQNYFDYVRKQIFEPAAMTDTKLDASLGNSAGGGVSTVQDMERFAAALVNHKLLGTEFTNLIISPKTKDGYAYGFETAFLNGERIVGHSGGGAADDQLDIYLNSGYIAVILSKPYAGRNVTQKIRGLITRR